MEIISRKRLIWSELLPRESLVVPSPSLPACSAAPPGRILDNMLSPSMPGWPAAALPIPPGLGAALEPAQGVKELGLWEDRKQTDRGVHVVSCTLTCCHCVFWWRPPKIPCKFQWAVDNMLYPPVTIQWDPVSYLSDCFTKNRPLPVSVRNLPIGSHQTTSCSLKFEGTGCLLNKWTTT